MRFLIFTLLNILAITGCSSNSDFVLMGEDESTRYFQTYFGEISGFIYLEGRKEIKDGEPFYERRDRILTFTLDNSLAPSDWLEHLKNEHNRKFSGSANFLKMEIKSENNYTSELGNAFLYLKYIEGINMYEFKYDYQE